MEQQKWILLILSQVHIVTLMLKIMIKIINLKFSDHVRIWKYKNIFAKGCTPNWSENISIIRRAKNTAPRSYVTEDLNPIQDGSFLRCSQKGIQKGQSFVKSVTHILCHTMTKLDAVVPYQKKIKIWYKSHGITYKFSWHQHFFHQISETLVIPRNPSIDCMLIHSL